MLCCTRGGVRYVSSFWSLLVRHFGNPLMHRIGCLALFFTSVGSNSRRFLALLRVAVIPPCVRMFYVSLYDHVLTGFVMYD